MAETNKVKAAREAREAAKVADNAMAQEVIDNDTKAEAERFSDDIRQDAECDKSIADMNQKLDGDAEDSERKTVIVERKFGDQKHKIFVSTVITKNGKSDLEQFRVPVGVEVELPVEIIAALKDRTIPKFSENKQSMVREFSIEFI